MSTPADAKRIVVMSTVGTMVLTTAATLQKDSKLPGFKVVLGGFAMGTILAAAAEWAPELAAGLATLVLITAAFAVGPDAWDGLSHLQSTSSLTAYAPLASKPQPLTPLD